MSDVLYINAKCIKNHDLKLLPTKISLGRYNDPLTFMSLVT